MKLVLLLRASQKYRPLALPLSQKLHAKNMEAVPFLTVGPGGQIDVPIDTPDHLKKAMFLVCDRVGDEQFILSQDNVFPVSRFNPHIIRSRQASNYLKRKGHDMEVMVNTISYLIERECVVIDHEIDVPQVIDSGRMLAMLSDVGDLSVHVRTCYFNMYFQSPLRTEDPRIDLWTHGTEPTADVVALSDTCFRHKKCKIWLRKKARHDAVPA